MAHKMRVQRNICIYNSHVVLVWDSRPSTAKSLAIFEGPRNQLQPGDHCIGAPCQAQMTGRWQVAVHRCLTLGVVSGMLS